MKSESLSRVSSQWLLVLCPQPSDLPTSCPWWKDRTSTAAWSTGASRWFSPDRTSRPSPKSCSQRRPQVGALSSSFASTGATQKPLSLGSKQHWLGSRSHSVEVHILSFSLSYDALPMWLWCRHSSPWCQCAILCFSWHCVVSLDDKVGPSHPQFSLLNIFFT